MNGLVDITDRCITCHQELAPCERNRSECLDCREKTIETYGDDEEDVID